MIFQKMAIPVIGSMIAFAGVSAVERALPVVMFMRSDYVSYVGGKYTAHVQGYKVKDCPVVPGTFVGWYMDAGAWVETTVTFINDTTPDSSSPKSYQLTDFGDWSWSNVPSTSQKVRVSVMHKCKSGLEITTVGPFRVEGGNS